MDASVLALRFTERIDGRHVEARLWDASGPLPIELDAPPDRPQELRVVAPPLSAGVHLLEWQSLAVDGHTASGTLSFTVGAVPTQTDDVPGPPVQQAAPWSAFETLGRLSFFLGVSLAGGLPVFASEVASLRPPPRRIRLAMLVAAGVATVGAAILVKVVITAAGTPWSQVHEAMAGKLAWARLGLAATSCGAAWLALRIPRMHAWVAIPAFLSLSVHAMGGHGLSASQALEGVAGHVAFTVHLVAAALWTAGVAAFLLLAPGLGAERVGPMVQRFFGLAVASAAAVGLTGVYEAAVHGAFPPDMGSPYVAMLAAKTALWVVLLAWGAYHAYGWRPRPSGGSHAEGTRMPRTMWGEAGTLLGVLVAAAVLASVPAPIPASGTEPPAAVFEMEGRTRDYRVRVVVHADPVRPDTPYDATVVVHAKTSRGADEARAEVALRYKAEALQPLEFRMGEAGTARATWDGSIVFAAAGAWDVEVTLGPDRQRVVVPVTVLDAARGAR